jgi:hypothetical protein
MGMCWPTSIMRNVKRPVFNGPKVIGRAQYAYKSRCATLNTVYGDLIKVPYILTMIVCQVLVTALFNRPTLTNMACFAPHTFDITRLVATLHEEEIRRGREQQ